MKSLWKPKNELKANLIFYIKKTKTEKEIIVRSKYSIDFNYFLSKVSIISNHK